ncbi:ImuA family protein [Algirhabdus cladophorae]|uniref:ImuA family protein n=1 Tax=Algirhabdus cladophorae TaxID=3377108 RepID=UPI003B848082
MSALPAHLISRTKPHRPGSGQPFVGDLDLIKGRVHEFCGNARRTLALRLAARTQGRVIWIRASWVPDLLNMDGVQSYINPGRLTFVSCRRPEDILWSMEEVLRSGAVPLVITEVPGYPGLTPIRRLHLAAETGAREGDFNPVGIVLTPSLTGQDGGAQGVETRWRLAAQGQNWHLSRLRARTHPVAHWQMDPKGNLTTQKDKNDRALVE